MFCQNCGKELRGDAKYCAYCGAATNQREPDQADRGMKIFKESSSDREYPAIAEIPAKRKNYISGILIATVFIGIIAFVVTQMFGGEESDLEKLEGTWSDDEGNGVIFYAPHDDAGINGDAEVMEDGETTSATYEWHESSKRIILNYADRWGDRVELVCRYEIEEIEDNMLYAEELGFDDTMILRLIPVEASDSTGTYTFDDEETVEFYKN